MPHIGFKHSEESKRKIREARKRQIPWNKGKKSHMPRCPDCGLFLGSKPHKCKSVDKRGPRFCPDCGKQLKNVGYERWHTICGRCEKIRWRKNLKEFRYELIQQFGGACQICGYRKYKACLEFHHKYGKEKQGKHFLNQIQKSPENFNLWCNRCHREFHIEHGYFWWDDKQENKQNPG